LELLLKIPNGFRVLSALPFSTRGGLCVEARLILFIAAQKINTPIGQSLSHIGYLVIAEPNWSASSLHLNKGLVKIGSVTTIMAVSSTTVFTRTHD
jgi:hypothetical protein